MVFIKKIFQTVVLAIVLLTVSELILAVSDEFSGSIGVMQSISKSPHQVGGISAKPVDLDKAVSDVINIDPTLWRSYLQSLQLRWQSATLPSAIDDLLAMADSPLSWVIIGLAGWQVIWKETGSPKNEI